MWQASRLVHRFHARYNLGNGKTQKKTQASETGGICIPAVFCVVCNVLHHAGTPVDV